MGQSDSFAGRPRIAHVTNHGYGGVEVPTGGAPDTGGQNVYVNAVVKAMVELGYHVTVFARGGFPFFGSERLREGVEPFGEHARYVYVRGGGSSFIRKEDIAVALDEEVDWLEAFVAREAEALGCRPWEVYELVNTHYWDAGVMGMLLQERWRSVRAGELAADLLDGVVAPEAVRALREADSRGSLGEALPFHVGACLLETTDGMLPMAERVEAGMRAFCAARAKGREAAAAAEARRRFVAAAAHMAPALASVAAADALGAGALEAAGVDGEAELRRVDRHAFTPHSLAVLKEENYREKPLEVRRDLKFCERRSHEVALARSAVAFAATSTEIAERLRTRLEVPTEKMFFFPPCVDRSLFRRYEGEVVDRSYRWLAERTGVAEARLREALLVYETSRMDRTKRKDLLMRAFARVARRVEDAILLVGGGPDNAVFEELEAMRAADPVLRERAFLLGFVPDEAMFPLFSMADVFASASEMEGFGMSVAQAAAVGTPIVASHLIPFAVQYVPEDAVVFRAGDEEAFADGIALLLESAEERERRGKRLEEATRSLDWVVQSDAFLDHLRRRGVEIARPASDDRGRNG